VLTSSRIRKYSITRSAASCCSGLNVSDGCGDALEEDGPGNAEVIVGDGATDDLSKVKGLFGAEDPSLPHPDTMTITVTAATIRIPERTITHTSIGAPQLIPPPKQEP